MSRKLADWPRRLPKTIIIPKVMTLKTLADVRGLTRHLPDGHRERSTFDKAAADTVDVAIALRMALMLENIECRPQ